MKAESGDEMARWTFTDEIEHHKAQSWSRHTRSANQQKHCPACGAPVVSEVCGYCGAATGLNTADARMEYPVLECKSTNLNLITLCSPGIFAVGFGMFGVMTLTGFAAEREIPVLLAGLLFLLIGIAASYFVIRTILRYIKVKTKGKVIPATVYGYMDDNILINHVPEQVVKLLVHTPNGPRFILYKLGNTSRPYPVNANISIMVHEDCFMICRNREVIQW